MTTRNVGEAWYEVDARINKLDHALDQADDRITQTGKHAEDRLGSRLTSALGGVGSAFGSILKVGAVAGGVAVAALGGIGALAIPAAAEWETFNAQFTALLGNADDAKVRLEELAEFGARTPFELTEIVAADKILTAFGVHSERNLEAVGNAAAASGRSYEEVAMTFARVTAGQFGEAFQNLAAMGIATREDLEMRGLKFDASGSFVGTAEEATEAVTQIIEEKFGGQGEAPSVMEAMSNTVAGQFSNLQDGIAGVMREIGALLLPLVRGVIDGINQALPVAKEFLIGVFQKAAPVLEFVGDLFGDLFNMLVMLFDPNGEGVGGMGEFADEFGGFGETVGAIVTGLVAYFEIVREAWSLVWQILGEVLQTVAPIIGEAIGWIVAEVIPPLMAMFEAVGKWVEDNWPMIGSIIERAAKIIGTVIAALWPIIQQIAEVALPILGAAFSAILPFIDTLLGAVQGIIDFFVDVFGPAIGVAAEAFTVVWEAVAGFFTGLWNGILSFLGDVVGAIIGVIEAVVGVAAGIPGPWQEGAIDMKDSLGDMKESVESWGDEVEVTLTDDMAEQREIVRTGGANAAIAYADGWSGQGTYLNTRVGAYLGKALPLLEGFSPPKEGPFRDVDKWGANIADTFAEGFGSRGQALAAVVQDTLALTRQGFAVDPQFAISGERVVDARLVVEVSDPGGALAGLPGGAQAVAGVLRQGIEATGLLRNLQHAVAIR